MEHHFATDNDLDLLAEWNHQLIRDEGHRNSMTVMELRERMRGFLADEYTAVIFGSKAEPVAFALYKENETEICLRQLFVKQNHRRKGIGRAAMNLLRNQLWPRKKRLTVEVLTTNTPGIAFWRSIGYKDYCITLEIMP